MANNESLGLDATVADTGAGVASAAASVDRPPIGLTMRSTVLPRLVPGEGTPELTASDAPRFEPVRLLGRGGIGEVTLVQDNDIHRPVALKRLRADAVSNEGLFRFVHEIRTVGQLEHPNIAPIYDVGIDDHGQHYFVMRYVEGETLEAIINKLAAGDRTYHERYTFEHRVQIFLGVLHAVSYAHSKQIVHRDIKPANIMVGPFGEVVLMDWGIAKKRTAPASQDAAALAATLDRSTGAANELYRTRHGSLVGTPAYMSPEQAAGKTDEIDERSDLYSLSVVFYELLGLQHYLPGRTKVLEMLEAIQKDKQTEAHDLAHPHQVTVPAELSWFLERGLEKDPALRYQSAKEMTDALQRVVAGGFAVQCYVTAMKRTGNIVIKFIDRHPRISITVISIMFALVVLGLVAGIAYLV